MREISITEVYDPSVDKFIPVKSATEKGIFDPISYDYHDPVDNTTYKVSEAAKRGLFNTSMSTVPDKLTIEKVRVAQTLTILKVVDPRGENKVLKPKKAIKEGIIDLKQNVYRNPDTNECMEIDEAIDAGFITTKIMKEYTEKVTEKYEEELKEANSDVETTTIIEEDKPTPATSARSSFNIEPEDEPDVEEEEPTYYERLKSTQLNKTIQSSKMKNDALAVALVKDSKKKKLINIFDAIEQKIFDNKSATYHDTENNFKINLASAIEKGYIILPDSEYLTKYIDKVRDVASCCWLDLDTAIDMDIIDLKNKLFKNTLTTNYTSLFQALKDNYLKLYDVDINTNMDFDFSDKDVDTVFDPLTNEQIPIWKAIKLGLVSKRLKAYIEPKSRKLIPLSEAVDKGLAVLNKEKKRKIALESTESTDEIDEKIIKGVIHPLSGEKLNLKDAIDYGILDYTECTLQDLKTGETLTLPQAYERGYLITVDKKASPSQVESPKSSRRSSLDSNDYDEDFKREDKKKFPNSSVSPNGRPFGDTGDILKVSSNGQNNKNNANKDNVDTYKVLSVELKNINKENAVIKKVVNNNNKSSMQDLDLIEDLNETITESKKDSLSLRMPLEEKLNSTEIDIDDSRQPGDRRSFLQKFKSKLFGSKKPEPLSSIGILNQEDIMRSLAVYDTKNAKEYNLMRAIHKGIVINGDRIVDTAEDCELSLREAVAKSIVYFTIDDSVKVDNTDTIFYNDLDLFLIYHAIDPITKQRISVNEAVSRNYLKKLEASFFDGREYILLIDAIEQQLVCGSYVHFRHLAQLINSCASRLKETRSSSGSFFSLHSLSTSRSRSRSKSKTRSNNSTAPANANTSNVIPKEVLKRAVKRFDEAKTYVIDQVYNTSLQQFIPFDNAVKEGIYLPASYQFYDLRKKKRVELSKAIKKQKIKVKVQSALAKAEANAVANTKIDASPKMIESDNLSEGTIQELVLKKFSNLDEEISSILGAGERIIELTPELIARIVPDKDAHKRFKVISAFNPIEKRDMSIGEAIQAGIYLPDTHEYYDLRYNKVASLEKAFKEDKVKIVQIESNDAEKVFQVRRNSDPYNLESSTDTLDEGFDLPKAILYYFPHEKKFVKFREVIQQGLYDPALGLIKDVTFKDYVSLNEALQRRVVKLIDTNVLYDKTNIYYVKSVLGANGCRISLRDAIEKEKIINRDACTFKYKNSVSLVPNAIREGFIEADVYGEVQIKESLRNFYEKVLNLDEEDNLKDLYPTDLNAGKGKRRNSAKKNRSRKGQFDEGNQVQIETKMRVSSESTAIYIVDLKNLEHISVEEAIANSVFNVAEREIADTSTGEYFTIKEAVARGLIATINHNLLEKFQKSAFYSHKNSSYIIDAIHDPKRKKFFSLQQSMKNGLFSNGIYRNPLNGAVYPIHEALEMGFVIGRQVEVEEIEQELIKCLEIPPEKPIRGKFVSESMLSQSNEKVKAAKSAVSSNGKIASVRDVSSGKLVKPLEAEKMGILNLMQGWFKDSRSMQKLAISDAIEKGFIVMEKKDLIESNNDIISEDSEATLNATIVSKKSQGKFKITAIVDPMRKVQLSVNEAISQGIFDPNTGTFFDPLNKKRYNMVEAIDMNLIKIDDDGENDGKKVADVAKNTNKDGNKVAASDVKSFSVRYAVDIMSKRILSINEASRRNIVDLQNGFLVDRQTANKMNFKTAYDNLLLFTVDDLDNPLSERSRFKIDVVRNSKSGKEMSLKSALAKGWISIDRRTYRNKATNEELPFSKAVDLGFVVLSVELPDSYKFESDRVPEMKKRALSDSEVLSGDLNGNKMQHFVKNPQMKLSGDGVQSRPAKKNIKKK